jgi:Dimethlysulfonioproprionate lyase
MNAWHFATMTDPTQLLHTPLGLPGSGRVRYGAAMALWRGGQISEAVLEVYRVASAHDARDPVAMLSALDSQMPPSPLPEDPLITLYAQARDYLLPLDHPGAAEVRARLPVDPGPQRVVQARNHAVTERWLAPALQAVATTHPVLASAVANAAGKLDWVAYSAYPRDQIGEAFAENHAFASIKGENAPFIADDFDLGLFLIAPGILYRDHRHAAPELYAPMTGPHAWRFGPEKPLQVKPAHQPVWNDPLRPHLTKVGPVPFLGFYVWTRDVAPAASVLPARDWDDLDAIMITSNGQLLSRKW